MALKIVQHILNTPILTTLLKCLLHCHFSNYCQRSFWQLQIAIAIEVSLRQNMLGTSHRKEDMMEGRQRQ
jgi:hypothetical protein